MPNDFQSPCVLPNPDNFVIDKVISTSGAAEHDLSDFSVKMALSGAAWNSSFHAPNNVVAFADDAELSWTIGPDTATDIVNMLGFDATDPDDHYLSSDYMIYTNDSLATVRAFENGTARPTYSHQLVPGDRLAVRKTGTTITYWVNGFSFYTSAVAVAGTLVIDCSFREIGTEARDIQLTINGVQQVIDVTSYVGTFRVAETPPVDIEMTGTIWASGWHAENVIALADDAMIIATIGGDAGSGFMLGFDATNPNEHYNTMDYAAYLNVTLASVEAFENAVSVGSVAASPILGDTIAVRKTGTLIEYLHNGVVFAASPTAVPGDLVLDNSFRNLPTEMLDVALTINGVAQEIVISDYVGSAPIVEDVRAGWDLVRDTTNYAISNLQAECLFNQDMADRCISTQTVSTLTMAWYIHHPSDIHGIVIIDFIASATVGVGKVNFRSTASGASTSTAIVAGVTAQYQAILDCTLVGADYSRIVMELDAVSAGQSVQIHSVRAQYSTPSSPIPVGPVGSGFNAELAVPMGAVTNANSDRALPASRARRLSSTLYALYTRPHCICTWSGSVNVTNPAYMQPDLYRWPWVRTPGGHRRSGAPGERGSKDNQILFWIQVVPDPVIDTFVYIQTGGSFTSEENKITVPSGGGPYWLSSTVIVPDGATDPFVGFPYPTALIGLWPHTNDESGRTTATILGFAAFAQG